jgi:hypothetical protein
MSPSSVGRGVHYGTVARERPHRRHRHVRMPSQRNIVPERGTAVFQRLAINLQPIRMRDPRDGAVMLAGEQVGERAAVIIQERVGARARVDHRAG